MSSGHPGAVRGLMGRLQVLGVQLPEDLVLAAGQLARLDALVPVPKLPAKLVGLSDAELAAAIEALGIGSLFRGEAGFNAIRTTAGALAGEIAAGVADVAEGILDQLRPGFDEAAAVVHHATVLGIITTTTAEDILHLDDVAAARDAWAALPVASRALTAIATVRIGLSRTAGVPPAEVPAGVDPQYVTPEPVGVLAESMFRTDGRGWRGDFEEDWQLWVRLCAGSPARLLSIEESRQAARGVAA